MGRAHGPRDPRERRPVWEPEPLHAPVDRPVPRQRNPRADDDASTDDAGDRTGSHVIVIDLA
ncbi:MAG TPA: hypothetical protein VIG06_09495 [Kofleriaceae bacterium]